MLEPNASRKTLPFFLLTLGITGSLQLPALLAQLGVIPGGPERWMLPATLGVFGPLLAAVAVSWLESRGAGVRALFQRSRGLRTAWYLVALGMFPAIHLAATAVHALVTGHAPGRWLHPPDNAQQIAALLLVPLAEEPGWRGFALPRLQDRYGALAASVLVGIVWALWHTIMFLLAGAGATPGLLALSFANIIVGSLMFSWIYNRTRGSLLIAILAHMGAHLNNPARALPGDATPFVVYTVGIAVTAGLLFVSDRSSWRRRLETGPAGT